MPITKEGVFLHRKTKMLLHLVVVASCSFLKVDMSGFQLMSALQVCNNCIHIFLNYFEFRNAICTLLSTLAYKYVDESLFCTVDN